MRSKFYLANTSELNRPIIFFHSPKTGGTSVDVTFRRLFGLKDAGIFTNVTDLDVAEKLIARHSLDSPTLLVSGHMSPQLSRTTGDAVRATIVRNPLDHLVSHFCYCFKVRYQDPDFFQFMRDCRGYRDKRFSAADLERWIATSVGDNPQTRFFRQCRSSSIDSADLQKVHAILDECELVGTTDRLHVFLMMLGLNSGLRISRGWHANTSDHAIIDEAPEALERRLRPYIEYDTDIYVKIKERIAQSPDWRVIEDRPSIPIDNFKPSIRERAETFFQLSSIEKSARIRCKVAKLKNWVGDSTWSPKMYPV